jgi:hypothetical protein
VFETVRDLVQRLAPIHLPLAHDITYFFAASSGNVPLLMSEPQRQQVREVLGGVLRSQFSGPGGEDRLVAAVHEGAPWIVWWVAWGMARVRANDTAGLPFDGWSEFAGVLLRLAERDPDTGLPFIVPFVTRSNMSHDHFFSEEGEWKSTSQWVGEFDPDTARRLFDFDRLVGVLASWTPPAGIDGQMLAQCEAAVAGAKRITGSEPTGPTE